MSSWILLGASRGLGAQFGQELLRHQSGARVLTFSRTKPTQLNCEWERADFSKDDDQTRVLERVQAFAPNYLVYFAGGGPYGPFYKPQWKDHRWALEVTFLFAARVVHRLSTGRPETPIVTLLGSAIAESAGDPGAASYAAGKAALRSLYETHLLEKSALDLRLYSPGYMDTELLPRNAQPRRSFEPLWQPDEVAADLYQFIVKGEPHASRRLTPYRRPFLL